MGNVQIQFNGNNLFENTFNLSLRNSYMCRIPENMETNFMIFNDTLDLSEIKIQLTPQIKEIIDRLKKKEIESRDIFLQNPSNNKRGYIQLYSENNTIKLQAFFSGLEINKRRPIITKKYRVVCSNRMVNITIKLKNRCFEDINKNISGQFFNLIFIATRLPSSETSKKHQINEKIFIIVKLTNLLNLDYIDTISTLIFDGLTRLRGFRPSLYESIKCGTKQIPSKEVREILSHFPIGILEYILKNKTLKNDIYDQILYIYNELV